MQLALISLVVFGSFGLIPFSVSLPVIKRGHGKDARLDRHGKAPRFWGKGGAIQKYVEGNHEDQSKRKEKIRNNFRKYAEKQPIRHIGRIPPPDKPLFDEIPSELAAEQKHSGSKEMKYSFKTMKVAFEAILDKHQRHPKRAKEINEDKYIVLKYDPKEKKYTMVEESSSEES